jgi:probable rRNA maturation factor
VLKGENRERENLSIAFVSPEEIQKLNKKYRKKDKPTDVLSFERISDFKDECAEIVLCPHVIRENAQESGLTLKKELSKMLIHGILHVLGYDHEISPEEEERMFVKQEQYLLKVK